MLFTNEKVELRDVVVVTRVPRAPLLVAAEDAQVSVNAVDGERRGPPL